MTWQVLVEVMGSRAIEDPAARRFFETPVNGSAIGDSARTAARRSVGTQRGEDGVVARHAPYAAARRRGDPLSTATTDSTVQRLLHRPRGINQ